MEKKIIFQPKLNNIKKKADFNPGPSKGRRKKLRKKATDVVLDNNDSELFNALF